MTDHDHAESIATEAGAFLLELRADLESGERTIDQIRKEADVGAHDRIMAALAEAYPADAILSEEGKDDRARLDARRVWIIDPLDGTREFGEPPRTDWAVHVALWQDGELAAGAVALPGLGETLSTARPPALAPSDGRIRMVVSRTRPPALTEPLRAALDAALVPMGSAGAKAMAVVRGEADVYAHGGGQYEWDSAAPVAVARAAGLHCSRLDGSPLRYNQPDSYLPDLLICRPELAERIVAAVHAV